MQTKMGSAALLLSLTLFLGLFPFPSSVSNGNKQAATKTELVSTYQGTSKRTVSYKVFEKGFRNNTFYNLVRVAVSSRLMSHAITVKILLAENSRQILSITKPVSLMILSIPYGNNELDFISFSRG